MEWKKFIISWVLGSVLLYITLFLVSAITMVIAPFNIFDIGGMRSATDPFMMLYYLYPVLLSFITTYVFSVVRGSLQGSHVEKGLMFGVTDVPAPHGTQWVYHYHHDAIPGWILY